MNLLLNKPPAFVRSRVTELWGAGPCVVCWDAKPPHITSIPRQRWLEDPKAPKGGVFVAQWYELPRLELPMPSTTESLVVPCPVCLRDGAYTLVQYGTCMVAGDYTTVRLSRQPAAQRHMDVWLGLCPKCEAVLWGWDRYLRGV